MSVMYHRSSPSTPFLNIKPITRIWIPHSPTLKLLPNYSNSSPISITLSSTKSRNPPNSSFQSIKPYIKSQWKSILQGWIFSSISVFSLSKIVPISGKLSSNIDAIKSDGLIIAALFGVRLISNYLQQALLWEAAFNCGYRIRVFVFERVLDRDLGFFDGVDNGVLAGDIAHRITSEAADVADTIFSLLNTIVPSTLQLSTMIAQMLIISPVLSFISALVIPSMVLASMLLGARLQKISRNAHMSFSALSAYLNEVLPSILFVKATNMEWSESVRFKRLASADMSRQLKKKKMKALIPQIVQAVYFGALFVFCAGSLVLSKGSFNTCGLVSFITSLVFLVEPIQDFGKVYNEWKQGEPAIERLFELTRFRSQVMDKPDAIDIDFIRGEVKFCGISFQYRDDLPLVLDGVDLHIKAGETVALVGPSGGGKTTLAKLLLRLYDPMSGFVLIDGHNIQMLRLECLRRHVALVSQDINLHLTHSC